MSAMFSGAQSGVHRSTMPLRQVTSDAIENQLMLMWRDASNAALAAGGPVLARNSVLTLVAYIPSSEYGQRVLHEVRSIASQVAARAIVLAPTPIHSEDAPIDVSLAITQRDTSGNPAHGEEILIQAYDDAVQHLPGAVLPLILSGLPSFLWWTGEPPWRSELLEALVDGCDRLVVDTADAAQAERALAGLADLLRRKKTSCAITDLNWVRQAPWRELVAQFFDAAETRVYLPGIDRVTIEYAAGSEDEPLNPAQAYLFAGWLASRLGWQSQGTFYGQGIDSARQHMLTNGQGRTIVLELSARFGVRIAPWLEITPRGETPGEERSSVDGANGAQSGALGRAGGMVGAVGPGALMSVHLHATASGKVATFAVARESDLEHASTLSQADCAPPAQTVHLPTRGEALNVVEQLQVMGHDIVYEEALSLAARLLGPGGRRAAL